MKNSDSTSSNPATPSNKDQTIKMMNELLLTNMNHIEHLKSMVDQLKKQLTFEQHLKDECLQRIVKLQKKVQKYKEKNQLYVEKNEAKIKQNIVDVHQSIENSDDVWVKRQEKLRTNNQDLDQDDDINNRRPFQIIKMRADDLELKGSTTLIQINSVGRSQSFKRSTSYIQQLGDQQSSDIFKRSIRLSCDPDKNNNYIKTPQKFNSLVDMPIFGLDLTMSKQKLYSQQSMQIIDGTVLIENPLLKIDVKPRIFENFYILGCQKIDLQEFDGDQQIKVGIVPAQVLFKYQADQDNQAQQAENNYEYIIHEFAYPFGVQVEKLRSKDSYQKIKEIMYDGNKYELLDKIHIFTLKNQAGDQNQAPFKSTLLEKCNPEYRLYGICLSVYDYIQTSPNGSPEFNQDTQERRNFWKFKKTYCFLTYFPFFEFFADILIQMINIIKTTRVERFLQQSTQQQEQLQEIDGEQIIQSLRSKTIELLEQMTKIPPPEFSGTIQLNTVNEQIQYQIPDVDNINFEIKLWSASISTQILSHAHIIKIFLAIMQELSVVIICQKTSILTALMHFIHNLIQPIKWINPVIYSLPESLLTLLESPIPIFVGVNLQQSVFMELDIINYQKGENLIYVFVNENDVQIVSKPVDLIQNMKVPYFKGILERLENQMNNIDDLVSFRSKSTPSDKNQKNQKKHTKTIRFIQDLKDKESSRKILDIFHQCIKEFIIDKLPKEIQRNQDGSVAISLTEKYVLEGSGSQDKDFIRAIFQTQFFNYFVDEFYQ